MMIRLRFVGLHDDLDSLLLQKGILILKLFCGFPKGNPYKKWIIMIQINSLSGKEVVGKGVCVTFCVIICSLVINVCLMLHVIVGVRIRLFVINLIFCSGVGRKRNSALC